MHPQGAGYPSLIIQIGPDENAALLGGNDLIVMLFIEQGADMNALRLCYPFHYQAFVAAHHTIYISVHAAWRYQAIRDCHGYGKTHGFEVTGLAGTGTVVDFGTPQCRNMATRLVSPMPRFHYCDYLLC